ncbi:MAG TPA: class I SAM-dependent methyltransferase [Gemmatimonadaceae bacterium]|jgi:SAM-dependent methyltransferase|nr:class I SAM-dependent methyltransferase [Gemmatimonadaceae bacterium]
MLRLPPSDRLLKTGPVDAVEQYFAGGFGWVLRQRLQWVCDALPRGPLFSVLEIGYGSAIFFYELSVHADRIVGIDVHPHGAAVRKRLLADRIVAELAQASGMALPFRDGSFDVVVIVSALEFMDDPGLCLRESLRVVKPGGLVTAVTPRILPWADRLYRVLVGWDPESDFRGGRDRVQRALADPALQAERRNRPWGLPPPFAPYELVSLRRPDGERQPPRPRTAPRDYAGTRSDDRPAAGAPQ